MISGTRLPGRRVVSPARVGRAAERHRVSAGWSRCSTPWARRYWCSRTCTGPIRRPSSSPTLAAVGAGLWRADVTVGDPGLCHARASGVAVVGSGGAAGAGLGRAAGPSLTGTTAFEVADAPADQGGAVSWQPIGPHAEAGWLAFGGDRGRAAVVSNRWPGAHDMVGEASTRTP